ncbi:MAG TPA: YhjD/YihY/BrkB family envelope integrity protein [Polyangiaceae bacterium]|nr:YhjD/YihY/BrkB family envelope integrity protein [Polyangiaceae bacterium]
MAISNFRWRSKGWLAELLECIQRTRTLGLAAETAFWLFLSLLPLLAVAGFLAARLSLQNWHQVIPILEALPPAAASFVSNELTKVATWDQGTVSTVGILSFLWLASSGVHAIFDALEIETGAQRRWLVKRALAIATCTGLSLSVALLALLGPGVEALLGDLGQRTTSTVSLGNSIAANRPLRVALALLILAGQTWSLFLIGIPKATRRRMPVLPSIVATTVLQALLSVGYTAYISTVGDGSAYTAGLALVGLVLTALYFYVLALLIGAIVNRTLSQPHQRCV